MSTDASVHSVDIDSDWMTPQEVADKMPGISVGRLSQWRKSGDGPIFHKFGRTVVYCRDEVDDWLRETGRRSTADRGRRRR